MIIFTKYSNERDPRFSIRTDILEEGGLRVISKRPAFDAAKEHIADIYDKSVLLTEDLRKTPLRVNPCTRSEDEVRFPYREGKTLEERLDGLLAKGDTDALVQEIAAYFALFADGGAPGCDSVFSATPEFTAVFGQVDLPGRLYCRAVSDIDMVFSNVIETDEGPELIDYEWTFAFPVPVKFIQYRCLNYYIYGTTRRDVLKDMDLFERFGISGKERKEYDKMEKSFQQYILGDHIPMWKLYDSISDGVIELSEVSKRESEKKRNRTVEIYFDGGQGYSSLECDRRSVSHEGPVALEIRVPEGTKVVRVDPCSGASVVRILELTQDGTHLKWTSNGLPAEDQSIIFDSADPQIFFRPVSCDPVTLRFLAEPMTGLNRELLLNRYKSFRWMLGMLLRRGYRKLKQITKGSKN
ncbi:MAG: hypothetical protein LUI13_08405 [Lachnospiraceae bacterium]|nr:hypothetical protein [Lachnospiraceae bacterium]